MELAGQPTCTSCAADSASAASAASLSDARPALAADPSSSHGHLAFVEGRIRVRRGGEDKTDEIPNIL